MHRPERTFGLLVLAAFCSTAALSPAWGDDTDPARRLQDVESELQTGTKHQAEVGKEIEALAADIATLRTQMVSTAAAEQEVCHHQTMAGCAGGREVRYY